MDRKTKLIRALQKQKMLKIKKTQSTAWSRLQKRKKLTAARVVVSPKKRATKKKHPKILPPEDLTVYPEDVTPVYFMHIPKTAGSTFSQVILQNVPCHIYHREYMWIDTNTSYYKWASRNTPIIVTILREPFLRWESHFNYHTFGMFQSGFDLSDALRTCLEKEINVNIMTKILAGVKGNYHSRKGCGHSLRRYRKRKRKRRWKPFSEEEMRNLLKVAKENLIKFNFVGFTDSLPLFQEKVAERLGITIPDQMENLNVNRDKRWHISEFDPELLFKLNEYDLKLYEFARTELR